MTADAVAFLEEVVGGPAHLFGHSVGAPVGLLVAERRPDLVASLIFSEGVFHHDGWKPGVLDPLPPDVEQFLGDLYGEVSPHGREHWPECGPASTTSTTARRPSPSTSSRESTSRRC